SVRHRFFDTIAGVSGSCSPSGTRTQVSCRNAPSFQTVRVWLASPACGEGTGLCSPTLAKPSPPPSWGRDRAGGIAEPLPSGLPPPLTPPHKGEGDMSRKGGDDSRTVEELSRRGIERLLEG